MMASEMELAVFRIRAHWDGRVFVPDEPVNLPVGTEVVVIVRPLDKEEAVSDPQTACNAWEEFKANPIKGLSISDESLRRENLYEERS